MNHYRVWSRIGKYFRKKWSGTAFNGIVAGDPRDYSSCPFVREGSSGSGKLRSVNAKIVAAPGGRDRAFD